MNAGHFQPFVSRRVTAMVEEKKTAMVLPLDSLADQAKAMSSAMGQSIGPWW